MSLLCPKITIKTKEQYQTTKLTFLLLTLNGYFPAWNCAS